jgi:predicted Fe-Mo cluster-binding NifX family protein
MIFTGFWNNVPDFILKPEEIQQREEMMRIAVTSTGKDLSCDVDPRFGRAAWFLVIDTESMATEAVENAQNLNLPQGAGIQAGKTIIENDIKVLITGNCGPKAFKVLEAAGIKVVTGTRGRVADAVDQFKNGAFEFTDEANVEGHWV